MVRKVLKAVLPLIVLIGAAFALKVMLGQRSEPEKRSDPPPPPLVRVVTAATEDVVFEVHSQGNVMAATESRLSSRVSGLIEWVSPSFEVGGFFAKGDVLLRLDPRDFELAVIRAEARVAAADLAVAREESEADVALSEWASLGTGEAGPLVMRVPHLADARAAAAAARAELEQARLNLERTEITAPFDGRVRTRSADLGQMVGTATQLGTLYAIDRVEVRLPVPDDQLGYLDLPLGFRGSAAGETGPPVQLSVRFAGQEWSWEGTIVRVEGEIDPMTRMVHLVAMVEDPYGLIGDGLGEEGHTGTGGVTGDVTGDVSDLEAHHAGRPPLALGMFVSAVIRGREVPGVVVLPRAALRSGSRTFVVDDQGRLMDRAVEILRTQGEWVALASGVEPGERVCVSILEAPVSGMSVRVEQSDSLVGWGSHP